MVVVNKQLIHTNRVQLKTHSKLTILFLRCHMTINKFDIEISGKEETATSAAKRGKGVKELDANVYLSMKYSTFIADRNSRIQQFPL